MVAMWRAAPVCGGGGGGWRIGDTPLSGVPTLSRVTHLGPVTRTVVAAGVMTDGMMES